MRLARFALLGGLAAVAVPATGAGDAPVRGDQDPGDDAGFGETIVVTGTRIPRKDLTTPAPVTVISREQMTEFGRPSVGDFLQTLPEQANALNSQVNNGGDGSTRISLRGLGDYRTLVLLNGRRLMPGGSGADRSVDLSLIPDAAIERIEVLKDGASPVYGSDAVAGVVNLITRRRWSGLEVSTYGGLSSRRDGAIQDVALTLGEASERGSILLSAGFQHQGTVWSGSRGFSSTSLAYCVNAPGQTVPNAEGNVCTGATRDGLTGEFRVGSDITPQAVFVLPGAKGETMPNPAGDARIDLYNQLVSAHPTKDTFVRDPGSPLGWRPYRGGSLPQDGGDGYNFQPENYLVTPEQRLSLFATGDHALGSAARVFFEALFAKRQSAQKFAPEPLNTDGTGATVSARNRWNPFGVDLTVVGRRLVEFSNRTFAQDVDALRFVAGVDGTLPGGGGPLRGWSWELSVNHGQTTATTTTTGYVQLSRLQAALGPSYDYGTPGKPDWGCGTGPNDRVPGCVPLNLFGAPGSITPDQIAGLTFEGTARGTNALTQVQANTGGELFRLVPDRPVSVAAGYEYRRVSGTFTPDPVSAAGDTATDATTKATDGWLDVHEVYGELSVPLLGHLPLAEVVEATASARAFKYRGLSSDWTWKLGGRWAPVRDVTLRGTWSTAYRAPGVTELYAGPTTERNFVFDPCAGVDFDGNPKPVSPACGPAANNGNAGSIVPVHGGGNSQLAPEKARMWTAGVVLEPRFPRGLTVALDYYAVTVDRAIRSIGVGGILSSCYPAKADVLPRFCEFITRDPVTQELTSIDNQPQNVWTEQMAGVDLAAAYEQGTPVGRVGLGFSGTWLQRYDLVNGDGSVIHAGGNYDFWSAGLVGGVYARVKFNTGLTWALGRVGAGVRMRYVGPSRECAPAVGGTIGAGVCSQDVSISRTIDAYQAWDALLSYRVSSPIGKTEVGLGVQNVLDAVPPKIYGGFAISTDPTAYDFMGRFFYLRLTHAL